MKKLALALSLLLSLGLGLPALAHQCSADKVDGLLIASKPVKKERTVYFNTKSYKYHSMDCQWAARCTRNCIEIPLSEAINRGGIPCKVCGGG